MSIRKRATCESDGKCSCCSKAFNGSLKYNTACTCFSSFLCGWASSSQFSIRWEAGLTLYSSLTRRRFCTLVLFIVSANGCPNVYTTCAISVCGCAQLVRATPSKLIVMGSNPTRGSFFLKKKTVLFKVCFG